jgi:hypothetical protein
MRECGRWPGVHAGFEVQAEDGGPPRCSACGHRVPVPAPGGGLVPLVPTRQLPVRAWLPELAARRRARRWPFGRRVG